MGKRKIDKQEAIERYRNGESVAQIAKDNNVSREAVYCILRELNNFEKLTERLNKQRKEQTVNKYTEFYNDIYELKKEGMTIKEISSAMEIPYKYVKLALKGTDLEVSKKARKERNERIFRLYKSGLKQRQLADMYNTTQTNISNILVRHFKDKL